MKLQKSQCNWLTASTVAYVVFVNITVKAKLLLTFKKIV